jgi:uncharacterized protein (TIGR00255 family)
MTQDISAAQSMTGFGSAEKDGCRVEIRSLNHRFLDISIKAPSFLNQHEMTFRAAIKERFTRGKIDVNISVSSEEAATLKVNGEIAGRIHEALNRLRRDFSMPGDVDIGTMAYFHEMFMETDLSFDIDRILEVFGRAVEGLFIMREKEGRALVKELATAILDLQTMNNEVRGLSRQAVKEAGDKLSERIRTFLEGADIDANRVLQEVAIIASKLDITEEISRIDSHLQQFGEVLAGGGIIGRKLDFVTQELNREVNTIASKSGSFSIAKLTVEMKTEIEKMREQVQNLQ